MTMTTAAAQVSKKQIEKMSPKAQIEIAKEAAKKDMKADTKAPAKVETPKEPRPRPAYLTFLENLISEGKMTQKEIVEAGWKEFPDKSKSTIETVIIDSKNPKYSRFGRVAVKDDKGILSFK